MNETAGTVARYTAIAGSHRHELEVRRSRFITALQRVESEDEVRPAGTTAGALTAVPVRSEWVDHA